MPISWKGTLQQYAGRLHRKHATKTDVRIVDFVDTGHPALLRMWDKRQRGYKAMGYRMGMRQNGAAAKMRGSFGADRSRPRATRMNPERWSGSRRNWCPSGSWCPTPNPHRIRLLHD